VNGALLASGSALLGPGTPLQALAQQSVNDWDGYGGIGEYRKSHGNPWEVVQAAHQIRDGVFDDSSSLQVQDTGEVYDLVVVGSGSAGLGAAYFFYKGKQKAGQNCLVLENHPIFGGEAKQNEFLVNGQRLVGPQGAWRMVFGHPLLKDLYHDVNIDISQFLYQKWDSRLKKLEFDRGFDIQLESLDVPSFGYFFDQKSHGVAPYVKRLLAQPGQEPFSAGSSA
jgi:spermidine dehydrogenase